MATNSSNNSGNFKKLTGGIAALAFAGLAAWIGIDNTSTSNGNTSTSTNNCAVATLPDEAEDVIDRILTDQDHIYSAHDGKHFGNYEGLLPQESSDFYREYTVDTPGLNHRGARRIVVGGGTENDPDVWYYTDDHYESFCEIDDAEDNKNH